MTDEVDDILERLMDKEEERSGIKGNQHFRHIVKMNAKLAHEFCEKVKKANPENPEQWLAAGQSVFFTLIHEYLRNADAHYNSEGLAERKAKAKLSAVAQIARIMAMIDAYPDSSKFEGFRNLSHDQLRKYFEDESKKWLT